MRSLVTTWLLPLMSFITASQAARVITSSSLNPCQEDSKFSATLLDVNFNADNKSVDIRMDGVSAISGYVEIDINLIVYGYDALQQKMNPCDDETLAGLCPMNTGNINFPIQFDLTDDIIRQIPGIAYTIPDIDAIARITIVSTEGEREQWACVEAPLSNGQTVYQKAVGWVTAVIAGMALIASAITNGLGHSNTAAHVAANAMSLFGYFQAQAFVGMTAVKLPPIVQSWTQNFQWSMGIIRVGFLQDMATWYQRSTGGKPSTIISNLRFASVQIQKRSVFDVTRNVAREVSSIVRRTNADSTNAQNLQNIVVSGIERVGFRAKIEPTNIFMTGYAFFVIFVILVIGAVVAFKFITEALAKSGKMKSDKFQEFRNGWQTILKGIMFRIILIGFPQMVVLCFWQLTVRDSAAEVVLAIFTIVTMISILGWAAFKVVSIARRSIQMHKNPAYILYSDPVSLNKWGFLYVQFKASAYYFIVPILFYILLKGMFVALSQNSGAVQAVAFVLIEAGLLVGLAVLRPYMDKKTNSFNIAISAIQFVSAIFLLIFSDVFNQPGIVTGVIGVAFFIVNVIFAFVLLIMVLVSSCYALFSKNPDTRYQPMRDDRGSFIKSQTQLNTELDALGATARGEGKTRSAIDDDEDSYSSSSAGMRQKEANSDIYNAPGQQSYYEPPRTNTSSPAPYNGGYAQQFSRPGSTRSNDRFRQQNNSSPWQRGAGYDH